MLSGKLRECGVVGAGGAGFPTYVKANSEVEFMIANGAECEPLIHKDAELMKHFPAEIVAGNDGHDGGHARQARQVRRQGEERGIARSHPQARARPTASTWWCSAISTPPATSTNWSTPPPAG